MIKIKLLILGANSFLGSNFLSQIIKNKNIECFATININDFRIKGRRVTTKTKYK